MDQCGSDEIQVIVKVYSAVKVQCLDFPHRGCLNWSPDTAQCVFDEIQINVEVHTKDSDLDHLVQIK